MRSRSPAGKGRTAAPHAPLPAAEPPRGAGWEPRSSALPRPFVFAAAGPSRTAPLHGDPDGEGSAGGFLAPAPLAPLRRYLGAKAGAL